MNLRTFVLLVAISASTASAQTGDALPPSLSGRWTASMSGGAFIDMFSIVFEGERAPGKVAGKLTWRGVNCGAKDEPIEATWDGKVLKFDAHMRANVNTQRTNGQCPAEPYTLVLSRNAGGQTFEGQVRAGNTMVTMTASP